MSIWPTWEKNKPFTLAFIVVFTFLTVFLWAKTDQAIKQTGRLGKPDPFEHAFTVDGEAKVSGAPDLATVMFSVESKGKTMPETQTKNAETANTLLAKVKALGIATADMQTSHYNSYQNFTYDANKKANVPDGWVVTQQVTVKVRNTSMVSKVLETVGQNGATNISGPNFTLDDQSGLKAKARMKAIEDANNKAKELAQTLGVRFEQIIGYNEYVDQPGSPIMYAKAMDVGGSGSTTPEVASGSTELTLHVTITYKLAD